MGTHPKPKHASVIAAGKAAREILKAECAEHAALEVEGMSKGNPLGTFTEFWAWVNKHPKGVKFGNSCGTCPLSIYLAKAKKAPTPFVGLHFYRFDEKHAYKLPAWAFKVRAGFDLLPRPSDTDTPGLWMTPYQLKARFEEWGML